MGLTTAGLTAAALALGATQVPTATGAPAAKLSGDDINEFRGLGDTPHAASEVDVRGTAVPSAAQRAAAAGFGADLRWNDFGTPSSILPADGSLGSAPGKPVAAARAWLLDNNEAFGLSDDQLDEDSLELVNSQKFAQLDDARAVLFRQRFGDLSSAVDGMVTVAVADGQIAYVSSSLVKASGTPAAAELSPREGWLAAAEELGAEWLGLESPPALSQVEVAEESEGWTRLEVAGIPQEQQARVRALPMADGTVRPVIEANVVNVQHGHTAGYTSLVDAVSGETLWRQSQVDQFGDLREDASTGVAMPAMEDNPLKQSFQGELVADCNLSEAHEFEITDNDTRQIVVSTTAVNPANDIVAKIYRGNEVISSGDTGTSPEAATYSEPDGGPIPQGTYSARVCMFENAAPLPPANYVGNVSVSSTSTSTGSQAVPFPPRWRYFTTNPTPKFSVKHSPKNWVTGCWVTSLNQQPINGCTEPNGPLRNNASSGPWDVNPNSELPTFTTLGNNASDREAWLSPLTPGGFLQAPFAPDRSYTTKFTDAWNNNKCARENTFVPGGNDILFSVQNLFVSHNRMHDYSYFLGFTEKNYNLQQNNFGNGGLGNDPEIGNVQAGAITGGAPSYLGRDNANQITLQDGTPGITNQYLFQPIAGIFYAPCTDGGLDMGIVGHEYTHAITNRMVGGPDQGLTSDQGGAMGESWGDLVGAEYQFSHGYRNGGNVWAVGLYATGNLKTAIRNYSINNNPLTFGELGYDSVGNQVHADGEIWSATNWRVRQALVNKHNKRFPYGDENLQVRCSKGVPNLGPKQSYECPGNRRWVQLMFDSYLLQQGATGMLDARNAFIAADQIRYDGGNKSVIWKAFARSGMGVGARSESADEGDPKPSFAAPGGNTDVTFRPTLPNGKVAPGKVYIGTYEGRATPVGDTIGKSKLDASIPMTPGTYPAVFQSGKTGLTRFTVKVPGGGSMVERFTVRKNLSAKQNGAKVVDSTEGSRNVDSLIDSTEATNWAGVTEGNVDKTKPFVTVDLAGKKAKTIRRLGVSALLRPAEENDMDPDSGSRFTALRKFAIDVCVKNCDKAGSWSRAFTSKGNAFPSVLPRPTSPKLNFREFSVDPVKAKQVRFVVLENQCTGFKGYAGEQDNDPTNPTDCKSGSDRGTIVHAAELEVFGR